MKDLKRVSRWITIKRNYNVSKRNSLYFYATDENGYVNGQENFNPENGLYLDYFVWNGRTYALDQFLNRFHFGLGFDFECKEYPAFITGYDGGSYFDNLYCELSQDGEKIRLYKEV